MTLKHNFFAILSLSFLWIFTGITSLYLSPEVGYEILAKGNVTGNLADTLLISGSVMDIAIGLWLLINYQLKWCLRLQILLLSPILFY